MMQVYGFRPDPLRLWIRRYGQLVISPLLLENAEVVTLVIQCRGGVSSSVRLLLRAISDPSFKNSDSYAAFGEGLQFRRPLWEPCRNCLSHGLALLAASSPGFWLIALTSCQIFTNSFFASCFEYVRVMLSNMDWYTTVGSAT